MLAIPVLSLRLGVADSGNDPTKFTTRRAYDLLSQGFGPGFNGPLLLAGEVGAPADLAVAATLAKAIAADPERRPGRPGDPEPERQGRADPGRAARASPQDESTTQARAPTARRRSFPKRPEARRSTCTSAARPRSVSTSPTSSAGDCPAMFVAILLFSFVLLMLVFRSLLVPLKAVIMNLLSIGAAYGVIVAIFQWGWVKGAIGIGKEGPIEAWVPMMLFAIVFGLSMDYEVFLLSRIKEEYDRSHDNARRGRARARQDRAADHRRGRDHDLRVRQLRAVRPAGAEARRLRSRVRGVHRRDRRAPASSCPRRWSCSATATGGSRSGSSGSPACTSRAPSHRRPRPKNASCNRSPATDAGDQGSRLGAPTSEPACSVSSSPAGA